MFLHLSKISLAIFSDCFSSSMLIFADKSKEGEFGRSLRLTNPIFFKVSLTLGHAWLSLQSIRNSYSISITIPMIPGYSGMKGSYVVQGEHWPGEHQLEAEVYRHGYLAKSYYSEPFTLE